MEERSSLGKAARWAVAAAVVAGAAALLALFESWVGFRSPVFAFNLHFVLMAVAVCLDGLFRPRLDGDWFRVRPNETRRYRRLGVEGFMRLLQRIGWTRALRDPRVFDGSRRTLASYERATRHGENAHAWIFLFTLAPIAFALARGWWDAAAWIGGFGVVFHVYPVMLQRTQRERLGRLVARLEAQADDSRQGPLAPSRADACREGASAQS